MDTGNQFLEAYKMVAEAFIKEALESGIAYSDISEFAAEEAGKHSDLYNNVKYYIKNPEKTNLNEIVGSKALEEFKKDGGLVSEMWDDFEDRERYYTEKYGLQATTWIPEWIRNFEMCPNCDSELFIDQSKDQTYCPFCV